MNIEIIGTESLGVRGLCCSAKMHDRNILFDPGLALGYRRQGLLPHPAQVSVGERVRENIVSALRQATDVVISHFHGDHMPLPDPNPYQLQASVVAQYLHNAHIWTKHLDQESPRIRERVERLWDIVDGDPERAEGQARAPFTFSEPVPHGEKESVLGTVMMTRLEDEGAVFVHASDIQLLDPAPVEQVIRWEPNMVLVSGPPLYLNLTPDQRQTAWNCALTLAQNVQTSIIDHHLLRSRKGLLWLRRLNSQTRNRVLCAADFMGTEIRLLEARRPALYEKAPVPSGWHRGYAEARRDASEFDQL